MILDHELDIDIGGYIHATETQGRYVTPVLGTSEWVWLGPSLVGDHGVGKGPKY